MLPVTSDQGRKAPQACLARSAATRNSCLVSHRAKGLFLF